MRHGLYLQIRPNGSKLWRLKYRIDGRARLLAMGKYSVMTLERVHKAVFEARTQVSKGIGPIEAMRAEVARVVAQIQHTFEAIARISAPELLRWYAQLFV